MMLFQVSGAAADLCWSDMLLVASVGFLLVFVVLVLMIFVMKIFGWSFTVEHKQKAARGEKVDMAISEEEVVAIMTALKLYRSDVHDRESELLTINRITRAYSPWNSKIHGLTQMPERIKKH